MLFNFRKCFLFAALTLLSYSCSNSYEDFADKSTDGYLIDSAKNDLDNFAFDAAIEKLEEVRAHRSTDRNVLYLLSVAYAGRAGLRIIDLFDQIQDGVSEKGLLLIFAQHFSEIDSNGVQDLTAAVTNIERISTDSDGRTGDENFYALFLYYSYIGGMLNFVAIDPDSTAKDLRANFRACHTIVDFDGARSGLTNFYTSEITKTLAKIVDLVQKVSVGTDLESVLDTEDFPTGLTTEPVCVASPNNTTCRAVRSLVNVGKADDGIGLGTGEGVCAVLTP